MPALVIYRLLWVVWPLPSNEQFEAARPGSRICWGWWTTDVPRSPIRHAPLIGNLPAGSLGGARLAGFAGKTGSVPLPQLLVFPLLFLLGTALTVNTGRVASLGTAIYLGYEMTIVAVLWEQAFAQSLKPRLATLP